jgi:transposase
VLRVVVTGASVPEHEANKQVLSFGLPDGTKGFTAVFDRWVDGGDSGHPFLKSVMDSWGWMIQVVLRPQQTQGFFLLKKRWVVEQTFGWLNWYRGLSKDDQFHDSAYGQAISLSWYPLALFIQPLRLAVNYPINTSDCFMRSHR